jgi:cellulose synthase/poly-beta-1,6-N-acetylglucosamine synthase-like glycosyltransferase
MSGRPCQASYVQTPARAGPPALQLSTFAFYIKNVVRQRALQRLAGRVHLLGTGMAFPWALFEQVELATANIVEDLEIGLQLANAGYPPLAVEEAIVSSDPAAQADTLEQRRRWEGGYLASAARWVPRMVVRSLGRGDLGGLWAAIDLLIPPLALLVTLDVAALLAAALLHAFVDGALWPLLALAAALVFAGIALTIAWAAGGSRYVTLGGLARIPVYLLWKLPLYAGLARKGSPKEWVRTRRG